MDQHRAPFKLDVCSREDVLKAVAAVQPQVIVHGAALTSSQRSDGLDLLQVNVGGTLNILEAAQMHPPQHLILLSSTGVYGPHPEQLPLTEEDSLRFPSLSAYGVSKRLAEQACQLASLPQSNIWILRLAAVYGPEEQASSTRQQISLVALLAQGMLSCGPVPVPRAMHDPYNFVHTNDLVSLIDRLINQPASGAFHRFNVGGPTHTAHEIALLIDRLRPGSALLERLEWAYNPAPRHGVVDSSLLAQQVGFCPQTSFEEGLLDYLVPVREEISA